MGQYDNLWRIGGSLHYSKTSRKAILLHNENKNPLISIVHGINMKESYKSKKLLLDKTASETSMADLCSFKSCTSSSVFSVGVYAMFCVSGIVGTE